MKNKIEMGLIIVKDDIFTKIRRNLFAIVFKKEEKLLEMMMEVERKRNTVTGKIIIPKEIKLK